MENLKLKLDVGKFFSHFVAYFGIILRLGRKINIEMRFLLCFLSGA